tara:strand:- start:119 stop:751 length:633 start_codon:yes stop_codon:yes gene_type:complete
MKYSVKEIFLTIQGEGYNSGRKAIFCRFSGCNLWNGEESSKKASKCNFCDTDFLGVDGINGGKYTLSALINKIEKVSKEDAKTKKLIVFTGGEPLLQLNEQLIKNLKKKNYEIAIETNGTIKPPQGVDWICVSPKIKSKLVLNYGNELKVVYPQEGLNLNELEKFNFEHFFLQPLHNEKYEQNLKKTLKTIMKYPKWKLSLQTHKYIGVK